MMTDEERALIDNVVQFDDVPVEQRDRAAARELIRELADHRPKFIFVNKVGAHFPVHDQFPQAYLRYTPVLPRGRYRNISDTGSRAGFAGGAEEARRIVAYGTSGAVSVHLGGRRIIKN